VRTAEGSGRVARGRAEATRWVGRGVPCFLKSHGVACDGDRVRHRIDLADRSDRCERFRRSECALSESALKNG
jgi:hypothetical protein